MHRRALLTSVSALAAARALAQPVSGPVGYRQLPPGPTNAANAGGGGGPPSTAPSLDLGFLTPGALDPRIVFTRASTGTYFDSGGVMRTAGLNIALQSANASAWTPAGATVVGASTVAPDGTLTGALLREDTTNAPHLAFASATIVSATQYTCSFYIKAGTRAFAGISGGGMIGAGLIGSFNLATGTDVSTGVNANFFHGIVPAGNGWFRCWITWTTTNGQPFSVELNSAAAVRSYTGDGVSGAYVWGAQVELGPVATQYAPTTTVANSSPRWDYDPVSLQLRGLLLEDQRTNGVRNSTMQGAVPGTPGTLPTNWAVNPNTSALSSQVVATGTDNGIPYLDLRIFGTASAASTYVIYYELVTGIPAVTGQAWTFNYYWKLAAGTLNGLTAPTMNLREQTSGGALVADHWLAIAAPTNTSLVTQRMTQSLTLNGGATVANIRPMLAFTVTNAAVVDATLRLAAPQAEQGGFATSFIPTTSAAVSRSIDSCSIPPANMTPWFTTTGSWAVEFITINPAPSNNRIIGAPTTVTGGITPMTISTSPYPIGSYDGSNFLASLTFVTTNVVQKGAQASAGPGGVLKLCLNAGAVRASTHTTGFGSLVTSGLRFMTTSTGVVTENGYGYIRRVQYYPRVLADAEMQSLTTITDPSLFLNFMNPNTLDPRITFTRASTATYTDVNGVLQTANNDTPRWDYDPVTHVLRGLLLEEARTNNLLWSSDFTNAAWQKQSAGGPVLPVSTANQTTAPDGTLTASSIVFPAVSAVNTVSQMVQAQTGTAAVYTYSVYLKGAVGGEQIYIFYRIGAGGYSSRLPCTLTTQWQRFVVTTTTLTAAPWNYYIGTDLRDPTQSATPAQTIYAWGAQVELGAFPTSFILTTGSTVTRGADVCQITSGNMGWYSAAASSLFGEFYIPGALPSPTPNVRELCGLSDGTTANRLVLRALGALSSNGVFYSSVTGTNNVSAALPSLTADAVSKQAAAWNGTTGHGTTNGGAIVSVNSALPGGINLFMIGNNSPGANATISGYVRVVQYWPRVLPDAGLQQATT